MTPNNFQNQQEDNLRKQKIDFLGLTNSSCWVSFLKPPTHFRKYLKSKKAVLVSRKDDADFKSYHKDKHTIYMQLDPNAKNGN